MKEISNGTPRFDRLIEVCVPTITRFNYIDDTGWSGLWTQSPGSVCMFIKLVSRL